MCGICGFVKRDGKIELGAIEKMLMPLEHRGPDDKGILQDTGRSPFCVLGHRRLSIIDLETGHQPISDESRKLWCVENGEIYNFPTLREALMTKGYKFRTGSDAEVIVNMYHSYGPGCVEYFNGMFAFAIWDERERSLFLARDRVGIKPLYYYFDGNNLLFSSSLKSFAGFSFIKREIDHESLSEYLQYLYINAPRTIFKSIKKLEPGSTLFLKKGKITINKYWDAAAIIRGKKNNFITDEKICKYEIKSLLTDSVKKRLISDVPLGVFLSGGVDSSIITALAARASRKKIKTFSVTFKGSGFYDESKFARKVSQRFDTEHHEIEIEPNLKFDLSKIIGFLDEPFADSSFVPTYYLSRFTKQHVKTVLSGTGGDDIFAGYRRYALNEVIRRYNKAPKLLKAGFSLAVNRLFPQRSTRIGQVAMLGRGFLSALNLDEAKRHNKIMSFINKDMQEELLSPNAMTMATGDMLTELSTNFKEEPYVNRALYTDFISYLTGDLLTKEDRATMAVGLEGRVPFLDHRLVEYSFEIEPALKLKGLSTKHILKKAFEDVLPYEILHREKHGFAFPISEHLRGDLKDTAKDILFSCKHGLFNSEAIQKLFARHISKKEDLGQHIWALVVFNLWYEKNAK